MTDRIARGLLGAQPNTALTDDRTQIMAMLLRGQQPSASAVIGFGDRMPIPPVHQPTPTSGTRG